MKIVEQTPTKIRLKASDLGVPIFLTLLGLPFFLAGLVVILFLGKLTQLECNRLEPTQVACQLTASGILNTRTTNIPVGELQGAEIETSQDSDGDITYRVALITRQGRLPLTDSYSAGLGTNHQQNTNQINTFLSRADQENLVIQQDDRWFAFIFGGIFMLVGSGIIAGGLFNQFSSACILDKTSGRLYLDRKNGFRTKRKEYPLHEIKAAKVVENTDSDGDPTYATYLVLRSGEKIPLKLTGSRNEHSALADTINQFLAKPR